MEKIKVLFMQSQSYFGSDSMIHGLMMRNFDRERVEVHVACDAGVSENRSAAYLALKDIPDLNLHAVNFGASVNSRSRRQILNDALVGGIPMLQSLAHLESTIHKNKIAILHGTEKPRDAFYGLLLARLAGAKLAIHLHVKVEDWISPLTRWAMRHADALIGVSDFVAQSCIAKGYPADRTFYVLNSLDASKWEENTDGNLIRQEFGINPDTPLLSIISRLFIWKGHTELIEALAIVKQKNKPFKLLIVGEDDLRATPGRGSYADELKSLVANLGLTDQVIFTGFRKDIRQILAASDVFAMPSFEEPCAVAYLEAMAMKKPVIALNSGGTPQLVDQGKAGLLSEPRDIDHLAENIITLIDNPALRLQLGEYGRKRVEQYFTPRRLAGDVEGIYAQILGLNAASGQEHWSSIARPS